MIEMRTGFLDMASSRPARREENRPRGIGRSAPRPRQDQNLRSSNTIATGLHYGRRRRQQYMLFIYNMLSGKECAKTPRDLAASRGAGQTLVCAARSDMHTASRRNEDH